MNNNGQYLEDEIIVRKVTPEDNFEDIAELIYETDDYIYPYWFHDSKEECKNILVPEMKKKGFFFNYESLYVAVHKKFNKIVGLVCIILPETDLQYDYSSLKSISDHSAFTIDNYIMELINEVKELQIPYISNVVVHHAFRGMKIGSIMLNYVISNVKHIYRKLLLDVLSDNKAAIRLYEKLGFNITSPEIMGIGYGPGDYVGQYSMELNNSSLPKKK